jgi:hypothetical protein
MKNFHYFDSTNTEITKENLCNIVTSALNNNYGYGTYIGAARCGQVCFDFNSYARENFIEVNLLIRDNEEDGYFVEIYTVCIEKDNETFTEKDLNHLIDYMIQKKSDYLSWNGETIKDRLNAKLNIF